MRKKEHLELNRLFKQLDKGQTPDFFQMMSAISDISTIYPDGVPASPVDAQGKKSSPLDDLYHQIQPRCIGGNCG